MTVIRSHSHVTIHTMRVYTCVGVTSVLNDQRIRVIICSAATYLIATYSRNRDGLHELQGSLQPCVLGIFTAPLAASLPFYIYIRFPARPARTSR